MSNPNLPRLLIVGYTAEAIPDLQDYINAPQPPSNYGAEAQAKWRDTKGQEKLEEARAESAFCKLTGRAQRIFVVDPMSQEAVLISADDGDAGKSAGLLFLKWLRDRYGDLEELFPVAPETGARPGIVFFGFDLKQLVRIVGTEAVTRGVPVPLGFWYQNETIYDPYDMLVESSRRDLFDLYGMLRLLQVPLPRADWEPHRDPVADAQVTAELLFRYQLYPSAAVAVEEQHRKQIMDLFRYAHTGEEPASEETAVEESLSGDEADLDPSDDLEQNQTADAGEEESAEDADGTEPAPAAPTPPASRRTSRRVATRPQ
jgi:hypothetical protein